MLFSSLCLQIFIFYFGIYRIFIFLAQPVKRTSKHLFTSWRSGKTGNRFCRSKYSQWHGLHVHRAIWPSIQHRAHVQVIASAHLLAIFKQNFLHESVLIQGVFYSHYWLWANSEESRRYSSYFLVNIWLLWFVW
jgi:hypothetical protein